MTRIRVLIFCLFAAGLFAQTQPTGSGGSTKADACAKQCGPYHDYDKANWWACYDKCMGFPPSSCSSWTGAIFPKFYVLGLVYAPPGCTSTSSLKCSTPSTVDYQASSTMGTKVSTSDSFKKDLGVKLGFRVAGVTAFTSNQDYNITSSDSHSETLSKGQSLDIKGTGNEDGVDHNQDEFILLLNPAVAASVSTTCGVNWYIGLNSNLGASLELYKIPVSYLKNPSSMPPNVAHQLQILNFSNADYQAILALDPFANGTTTISSRFAPTTYSFPYEPTEQQTECNAGVCSCTSFAESTKNSFDTDSTSSSTTSYQVGVSVGGPTSPILPSAAFTWTTQSSKEDTTDSTQTATVSIACPSTSYQGPTEMAVYWDTLFGSFMFKPEEIGSASVLSKGLVTNATGKPVAHRPVQLAVGHRTYHTMTDSHGHFVFISEGKVPHPSTAKLTLGGASQVVKLGRENVIIRVH